jgi:uncharacterized protein
MNSYGVGEKILQLILQPCMDSPKVKKVVLYGSRARGDYRQGSDIDLAIDAPQMTEREFAQLWNAIDDLPIIYSIDIVHLQAINDENFLAAINQEGVVLYDANLD